MPDAVVRLAPGMHHQWSAEDPDLFSAMIRSWVVDGVAHPGWSRPRACVARRTCECFPVSVGGEVLVGLAILVGLIGIVVQILPGNVLVLGAILVWAIVTGGTAAWVVFAVAAVLVVAAEVSQYVLAGRHMRRADVPWSTLVWGGIAGVVGFFVIPVIGLFIGFVLAVFLAELVRRRDRRAAWRATVAAMQATGITILVQLLGGLLAAATWGIGLAIT